LKEEVNKKTRDERSESRFSLSFLKSRIMRSAATHNPATPTKENLARKCGFFYLIPTQACLKEEVNKKTRDERSELRFSLSFLKFRIMLIILPPRPNGTI
jgi:hypothetical protein